MAFNNAILFAFIMACVDVIMMGILKMISTGTLKSMYWMILPTLMYAAEPWIFLQSLRLETMVVMNLLWNLISDMLVTANGLFYFKEKLSHTKTIGVVFSLIGIFLMSYEQK